MEKSFKQALQDRRTYYAIGNQSPVADRQIEEILKHVLAHVPSAFNSQSTRIVLLLGKHHIKLWTLTKDILRKLVPADSFPATENKIDNCFLAGYGTVLFFEDMETVAGLQKAFPSYADNFPIWSQQTCGMHQLAVWTMLEEKGFGANLQHYNPLIDDQVAEEWNISKDWKLVAEMPFGTPLKQPDDKTYLPIEKRLKIIK